MTQQIKYKRVLLKLSGESLMGSDPFGINHDTIVQTVGEIAEIVRMGVQVGIVVGGGNIFRGDLHKQAAWTAPLPTTWA